MRHFEPTHYFPGTGEKIDVMESRLAGGLPLFHPDDAKRDGPQQHIQPHVRLNNNLPIPGSIEDLLLSLTERRMGKKVKYKPKRRNDS